LYEKTKAPMEVWKHIRFVVWWLGYDCLFFNWYTCDC